MVNMKKKFLILLFLCPLFVKAENLNANLTCPSSASASSIVTCSLNVSSDFNLAGLQGNVAINGGTINGISANSNWSNTTTRNDGFVVQSGNPKSGQNTPVSIKFKMPNSVSATIKIFNIKGTTQDYKTIKASNTEKNIRVQSDNSYLKNITIQGGNLNPSFAKNTYSYSATVNSNSTYINAETEDNKSRINGIGRHNLNYGNNTISLIVTSESGKKSTYKINITRPDNRSGNNNLSNLSLSTGNLKFNGKESYNINVNSDVSNIKIDATLSDSKSSFVKNFGPRNINLRYGNNRVYIKVQSEKGTVKTYTININRQDNRSDNNYLSSINLSKGALTFDRNTLNYNVSVPYETEKIDIEVSKEDEKATVTINNKDLIVGMNQITINVTSERGNVRTYTLNITRLTEAEKMSDNNEISKIDIVGHDFELKDNTYEYNIDLDAVEDRLILDILMKDSKANYIVDGNEKLKDGSKINIKTTSESGKEQNYILKINKKKPALQASKEQKGLMSSVMSITIGLIFGIGIGIVLVSYIPKLNIKSILDKKIFKK